MLFGMHLELLILGLKDTERRDTINSSDSPSHITSGPSWGIKFTLQAGDVRELCATVCATALSARRVPRPDVFLAGKSLLVVVTWDDFVGNSLTLFPYGCCRTAFSGYLRRVLTW